MKRTLVSLPDELFEIMKTKLMGKFGESDSEIIRGIVISYLSEHGYLSNEEKSSDDDNMWEEIIGALVTVLEEKGIVKGEDIDNTIKKRLKFKKQLISFDELN